MKYCVIKNTSRDIDSNQSIEVMLQNAGNAGFTENEVEIITEDEYLARKELEHQPIQEPTLEEKNRADIDYISIMLGVEL